MKISIIIVSFNTAGLLQNCLTSVIKALSFSKLENVSEIIVVDNASTDGSVDMVEKNFPKVHLICNKKNLGFAAANNQGIQKAKGEYILLLNSDAEVEQNALNYLLAAAKKKKEAVVVGGRLLNRDGSAQPSAGFMPELFRVFLWMTFLDDIPLFSRFLKPYHVENIKFYEMEQQVDWISGACMLVDRKIVDDVGVLDGKIFMYGEEIEWCYRIRKESYQVLYTPRAIISHYKGGSGGGKGAGIMEEYSFLKYFYKKYKPVWQYPILTTLLMFGALLRFLVFGIIKRYPERAIFYAKILKKAGR